MAFTIAVAGKGGTGKTTISGLIIRYLLEKGHRPLLAVDADPPMPTLRLLPSQSKAVGAMEEVLANILN